MYKFLIGPALMGVGYAAGQAYGADSEELVHKSPGVTYAAVEQALENVPPSGQTFFEGGKPTRYELRLDRVADQHLRISLSFAGQEAAEANLDFVPENGGRDTRIVARIKSDHTVLRTALAGTDKARLAYAPDWMLNLTARPVLKQLAMQIEQGSPANLGWTPGQGQAQWEANLNAEQRETVSEARQYEATRPAVDPDADAQQYMSGHTEGR